MQVTEHDSARPSVAGRRGRGRFVLRHRIVAFLLAGCAAAGLGAAVVSAESTGSAGLPDEYVMSDLACTEGAGALTLTLVNNGETEMATFLLDAAPNVERRSVVVAPGQRRSVLMTGLEDGEMGFPVEVAGAVEHVQATVACRVGVDRSQLGTRVHHMASSTSVERHGSVTTHTALLGGLLVFAGSATAWVVRRRYAVAERHL